MISNLFQCKQQNGSVVGETKHWQEVGNQIGRENEIAQCRRNGKTRPDRR
jgi:hypothetical protein